ncbi:MAG: hypothetical protein U9Q74_05380, partial [Gemmatimonadota bacterium]|nr:hypothetical protein [Gemmatimonadota bacterium]
DDHGGRFTYPDPHAVPQRIKSGPKGLRQCAADHYNGSRSALCLGIKSNTRDQANSDCPKVGVADGMTHGLPRAINLRGPVAAPVHKWGNVERSGTQLGLAGPHRCHRG